MTDVIDGKVFVLEKQIDRRVWRPLEIYSDLHDAQVALAALALVGVRCAIRVTLPEATRRHA